MAEINFYNIEKKEKELIFQGIANKIGIPAYAAEKDWWVMQTLSIVFQMEVGKYLVFKGGTSLSKGWNLIKRFSEDIDLALDRAFLGFKEELSGEQVKKLRSASHEYISQDFFPALQKEFKERGFSDVKFELIEEWKEKENAPKDEPVSILIHYSEVIPHQGYIKPNVKLEIGSRALKEPFTLMALNSFVYQLYKVQGFVEEIPEIPTVDPERTFLEKLFLLHEEFHKPLEKIRVDRLSRHIYDLFYLSKTEHAENAIQNQELYETIVAHRRMFSRVGQVDYNLLNPLTIDPIPIKEVMEKWEKDYETMRGEMIYGEKAPNFKELIENLMVLKERLSNVKWKFSLNFPIPKTN